MAYTYHSDGALTDGHHFDARQLEMFTCRLQHQMATSMPIVEPFNCIFGWVNSPGESKWKVILDPVDFRFTYPDWLLLNAIYQQWFGYPETDLTEVKKDIVGLMDKVEINPLFNDDLDLDDADNFSEREMKTFSSQTSLDANSEPEDGLSEMNFESQKYLPKIDSSGWGKKLEIWKVNSEEFVLMKCSGDSVEWSLHFIPFVPFFFVLRNTQVPTPFPSHEQQVSLLKERLLLNFPNFKTNRIDGHGDLFSAVSCALFGMEEKSGLVKYQAVNWLKSNHHAQEYQLREPQYQLSNQNGLGEEISFSDVMEELREKNWNEYFQCIENGKVEIGIFTSHLIILFFLLIFILSFKNLFLFFFFI
jgi:hypothetical protein